MVEPSTKARRLRLSTLVADDLANNRCNARRIEMSVDGILGDANCPAYGPQFFQDARIYNLREAWLYLRNMLTNNNRMFPHVQDGLNKLAREINVLAENYVK